MPPRPLDRVRSRCERLRSRAHGRSRGGAPRTRGVTAAGAAAALLAVPALVWSAAVLPPLLADGLRLLRDAAWTQVFTRPVHSYLTEHAGGLAVTVEQIGWAWTVAGCAMWLPAVLWRSWGARVGWTLYGIAGLTMVAAGSAPQTRWAATGVTAAYWVVLTLPMLRRSSLRFRGEGRRAFESWGTARHGRELAAVRRRLDRLEATAWAPAPGEPAVRARHVWPPGRAAAADTALRPPAAAGPVLTGKDGAGEEGGGAVGLTGGIVAGAAYLVRVPDELSPADDPHGDLGAALHREYGPLRGGTFTMTVTACGPHLAEGVRVVESGGVDLELTPEQVGAFGLQPGVSYRVRGELCDDAGRAVEMPLAVTVRVPVRWLRPLGAV
ncbi:hypothetical protein [Planomonospora parontospora]|uniref:hypothetical protein n=1 Tax=Planomonospora parontospora TaxID=58119 RepID=UPI00166FA4BC|nr:hypothetical protein [Planomonospora parontospora]GGL30002.1 hypothetical protein GCM10014719_34200 [Planomonospora parontospora subsp. antibiotica]GII17758.1 hypothetical protein Ppa05_44840 [Planomonospora parontospora subsp. antibiotica]